MKTWISFFPPLCFKVKKKRKYRLKNGKNFLYIWSLFWKTTNFFKSFIKFFSFLFQETIFFLFSLKPEQRQSRSKTQQIFQLPPQKKNMEERRKIALVLRGVWTTFWNTSGNGMKDVTTSRKAPHLLCFPSPLFHTFFAASWEFVGTHHQKKRKHFSCFVFTIWWSLIQKWQSCWEPFG